MTAKTFNYPATIVSSYVSANTSIGFFGQITWSGQDRAIIKRANKKYKYSVVIERYRVRKGVEYVYQKWKQKTFTVKGPRAQPSMAPHAFSKTVNTHRDKVFQYHSAGPTFTGSALNTGYGQYYDDSATLWTSNDTIALLGKLQEKVAGSDFNAGVFLGESKQALQLLKSTAVRITGAVAALRSGRWGEIPYKLGVVSRPAGYTRPRSYTTKAVSDKDLANEWISWQYGWLPLLKDAEASAQFIAHNFSVPPSKVYKASRTLKVPFTKTASPTNSAFDQSMCQQYVRKGYKATLTETSVVSLSGLTDPLQVAWELLPWSFVIDWFIPIGNFLQARNFANSVSGTFEFSSKRIVKTGDFTIIGATKPPLNKISGVSNTLVEFSRVVTGSLAIPKPNFKPLEKVASWKHCFNAVALLLQRR